MSKFIFPIIVLSAIFISGCTMSPQNQITAICEEIQDSAERDNCWFEMVRSNNDSSFCINIQDIGIREYCQAWWFGR